MTNPLPITFMRLAAALAAGASLALPMTAHADATLFLSSASAALGNSGQLCVSMTGGGGQIAGIQANLRWDDTCMTPTNAKRLCAANPATGKNVQSALQGRGALKAILISFSDVNPIPDGQLFCCDFTAVGNEGTRCAAVQLAEIIGSTGTGTRINTIRAGNTGTFTVLGPGGAQGGGDAVVGGPGPDTGAGQAPAPVAQAAPPGAVVGDAGAPAGQPAAPSAPGAAPGGPLGGPAVPGMPAQPRAPGQPQPPPQYGDTIREPVVQPPDVPAQGVAAPANVENLGAPLGTTTPLGTVTPVLPTATQQVPPTPTKQPDTPTPIPPTSSPTPESGWMGGCEMRIPR